MLKTNGQAGPAAVAAALSTRKIGEAVWSEMRRLGVAPTPRNFTLWFTYRAGADARLGKRMAELLAPGGSLSPDLLDTLYEEYVSAGTSPGRLIEGAAQIEDAARTLIDHIAHGREAADGYGDVLAQCRNLLGADWTQDGLLHAVSTLVAETARAAERNRALQDELTVASTRIARLRQSLTAVRQEAVTDALTGIANRKAFEARLRRLIRAARADRGAISVLLFDIDHFKAFNDAYGHRTGDLVLRLVARVLADTIRGRDCAARYGGEEFAVLLAGAELAAAVTVARQISDRLAATRLMADPEHGACKITVSGGVAQHRPGETVAVLVDRADKALYEAKRRGRNQVCAAEG